MKEDCESWQLLWALRGGLWHLIEEVSNVMDHPDGPCIHGFTFCGRDFIDEGIVLHGLTGLRLEKKRVCRKCRRILELSAEAAGAAEWGKKFEAAKKVL